METMCTERREEHNAEVPGRKKKRGGFPSRWIWPLQQREAVKWRGVQIRSGATKALEEDKEGGGLLGSSCEGVLLDLDDCLQKSLDASRQTPLPFKHSGASSFTPAAAVRQKKGANMFLMSSSCMYRAALPGPSEPARAPRWPTRCHVWERTSVG